MKDPVKETFRIYESSHVRDTLPLIQTPADTSDGIRRHVINDDLSARSPSLRAGKHRGHDERRGTSEVGRGYTHSRATTVLE